MIRALRTRGTCRFLTRRTLRGGTGHVRDQSFAVGDSAVQVSQRPVRPPSIRTETYSSRWDELDRAVHVY